MTAVAAFELVLEILVRLGDDEDGVTRRRARERRLRVCANLGALFACGDRSYSESQHTHGSSLPDGVL